MRRTLGVTLLSVFCALSLLFSIVIPVVAFGSQSWNLDILDTYITPTDDNGLAVEGLLQMEKTHSAADNGQGIYVYDASLHTWKYLEAGIVPLTVKDGLHDTQVWIADQAAENDLTFSGDADWELELVTDAGWDWHNITVRIGEWDGSNFNEFDTELFGDPEVWSQPDPAEPGDPDPGATTLYYKFQADAETIHLGKYLAIQVTNEDTASNHWVYCGEGEFSSCLTSPGSDPGYPTPELAAGILLGAGLLGLGGFILVRRKRSFRKV